MEKLQDVQYKFCKGCEKEKPLSDYYKDKNTKLGVATYCKDCTKQRSKDWNLKNPERRKAQKAEHYQKNKKRINEKNKKYYYENWDRMRQKGAEWKRLNMPLVIYSTTKRKKKVRVATPNWLSKSQKAEIQNFYWLAQDLKSVTGESYHVDHIVPLVGDHVCGLHVPWNLQVLPADINLSKGNKYDNFT